MRDSLCIVATKVARDEISYPQSGVGSGGIRSQDLEALSLWGPLYHIHKPQEFNTHHGPVEPENETTQVAGCIQGLRL